MHTAESNFGFSREVRAAQYAAELDPTRYPLVAATDEDTMRAAYVGLGLLERNFSPNLSKQGYTAGSAENDDDMLLLYGRNSVLVTAEHATEQMRLRANGERTPKEADYGTGALGMATARTTGAWLVAPLGRQTHDANHDLEHPLKAEMRSVISGSQPVRVHLGIHGMGSNRVQTASDQLPFGAILGIGDTDKASEATRHLAARIVQIGRELGMRIGINTPIVRFQAGGYIVRQTTRGSPPIAVLETITFAATHPGTSRAFTQRAAQELGIRDFAAVQMELSGLLRLMPWDYGKNPGITAQIWGTYLGRIFVARCVEAAKEIT